MSHEALNPYHRSLGRILITFFAAHATLYINFYIQSNLLHRFKSSTVILGLTAISTFALIATSSLQWVRTRSYLLFFVLHVLLSIILLPILWLHVSHLRIYIIESALVYILIIAQRNFSQTPTLATLSLVSPTAGPAHSLLEISIPLPRNKLRKYKPGQHIYLSIPPSDLKQPWQRLAFNPFTIASSSAVSASGAVTASAATEPSSGNAKTQTTTLLIRPLRSATAKLAALAQQTKGQRPVPMMVEGPYGSASYFPDLASTGFSRILLVAGGVGASFTLPIYRGLWSKRGGQGVKFVWSVKGKEEALSGLSVLHDGNPSLERVEIYCTQGSDAAASDDDGLSGVKASHGDIELEERANLLGNGADDEGKAEDSHFDFKQGRPDLGAIVDGVFEGGGDGKVAVLVCGPSGMGRTLREEVRRWVWKGREVFWHNEEFGW